MSHWAIVIAAYVWSLSPPCADRLVLSDDAHAEADAGPSAAMIVRPKS